MKFIMDKYNIDKSFGMAAKFRPPLNKGVAFVARMVLKNSQKCLQHRDDIVFETERIRVLNGVIDVHIITPRDCARKNPGLFYIHGGGFVYDAAPYQYRNAAEYAVKTGSVVIFPRYGLTPKFSNPTLIEDCLAAWQWTLANADRYKIDPERIGVGGDSAGGYLAARLTNLIIKNHGKVRYQLLIYPVIDSGMRTESMRRFTDTPMWNAKNNKIMWRWYYDGGKPETSLLDETLPDDLPPTYIETAEFDCLHDEGLLYADKLNRTGAAVTVYETRLTMHGFDSIKCEITEVAKLERTRFIRDTEK